MVEFVIARNPDAESSLPYLIRLPIEGGLVFRARDTWPRTKAVYCHPVEAEEWAAATDIVERVGVRSCVRRGAAIDLVLDRGRENRSQLVYSTARGRQVWFWQSPRTRKQARPGVRPPTARAGGLQDLEIIVDTYERYAYRFADLPVTTVKRALPCGDYGITCGGRVVASVERKAFADLLTSLTTGKLKYAVAELAALPRSAVVVEDRYAQVYKTERVRPAVVADGLAELQVQWPAVPIVFCETRPLAEQWTYRFLAAAHQWAADTLETGGTVTAAEVAEPTTAEVRAWARAQGLDVPPRGQLRPEIWDAFRQALSKR